MSPPFSPTSGAASSANLNLASNTGSGPSHIGGIVGGVIGGLVLLVIGSLIVFYTRKSTASFRNSVVGAGEQRLGDSDVENTIGRDLSGNLAKDREDQAGGRLGQVCEDQPGGRLGK